MKKKIKILLGIGFLFAGIVVGNIWFQGVDSVIDKSLAINTVNGGEEELIAQRSFAKNKNIIGTLIILPFVGVAVSLFYSSAKIQ